MILWFLHLAGGSGPGVWDWDSQPLRGRAGQGCQGNQVVCGVLCAAQRKLGLVSGVIVAEKSM